MGEDDIKVLALAEKNSDEHQWNLIIKFSGHCMLGCKSRQMLTTDNLLKAIEWVDYHRRGSEHTSNFLQKQIENGVVNVDLTPVTQADIEEIARQRQADA